MLLLCKFYDIVEQINKSILNIEFDENDIENIKDFCGRSNNQSSNYNDLAGNDEEGNESKKLYKSKISN